MFTFFFSLTSIAFLHSLVAGAQQNFNQAILNNSGLPIRFSPQDGGQWNLDQEPNLNSTSHFVFNSVSSLLQLWPNSRYRNGHTVIPATVPRGTLLYHGTAKNHIPDVPEWVSLNPEHSFNYCLSVSRDSGCWQLTLMVTRPLKVLYFDGSSAAKMEGGTMDTQDLVIWGKVRPDKTLEEAERIKKLCEWGKRFELDGFLRMTVNFEIMLCDFSIGVKPVSFLNLVSADSPSLTWPDRKFPLRLTSVFRSLEAGSWNYHFPGETRVHLDYARLISFYDTSLFPSLQSSRNGQNRLSHRLETISPPDANVFIVRLNDTLATPTEYGSGIDWQAFLNVITYRHAERLELLHYILNSTSVSELDDPTETEAVLKKAYRHVSSMISPYRLHSASPLKNHTSFGGRHSWATPVFELCSTSHSREIELGVLFSSTLTSSERLILQSTNDVLKEICRVLVGIWAEGMEHEMDEPDITIPYLPIDNDLIKMQEEWKRKVESLMKWLDWSYWTRCRPACSYEEMCFMPEWPFFLKEDERANPQPKCIRRLESFLFEDEVHGGL